MGIEITYTVKKSDAIKMLDYVGVSCYDSDSNELISCYLYDFKDSPLLEQDHPFENYKVVDNDYVFQDHDKIKPEW